MNEKQFPDNSFNPRYQDIPEAHEVHSVPMYYDGRSLSWKILDPSHPLARDPEYIYSRITPRQQAEHSCNIIQLYSHLEYLLPRYQMRYAHSNTTGNIINMPYQFIEPKPGWKLIDRNNRTEHTVKAIKKSKDIEGLSTFGGLVVLDSPVAEKSYLEWLDPLGEIDGEKKVISMIRSEQITSIAGQIESSGQVADVKNKPFTPVVSYCLDKEEPGSVSGGPFSDKKENKPRIRAVITDPNNTTMVKKVWGWWLESIIEFKVHAVGSKVADRVRVWLQNFFLMYTGVLKQLGVQETMYWRSKTDSEERRTVYDLSCRTIQYYFRLEQLLVEMNSRINHYEINLQSFDNVERLDGMSSEVVTTEYPVDTSDAPLYGTLSLGDDSGAF